MKTFAKTLAALAFAGFSAASFAEYTVEIYGNYNTNSTVGNVSTTVNGNGSHADVNVAGIQGNAKITGNYTATAQVGNITSNVQGANASANVNIGGVQTYKPQ